jgi:peptide chain release factor subunit 1
MFDPRLACKVIKMVDVSYGGENGLNQAIELSQESLQNVKFVQEKNLISKFFQEIAMDSGKFCSGINETMKCLEDGSIETLILFEGLEHIRLTLKNKETQKITNLFLKPDQLADPKYYIDPETKVALESVEQILLTEWVAENYQRFGADLEFITNKSPEGFQFVQGFGGMGGLLRYKLDLDFVNGEEYKNDDDDEFI